jgi:hypothetical protein
LNAFAAVDVFLPEKYQPFFHTYCLTRAEGSRNDAETSPFPRMVDMWFMALCVAVKEGLRPDLDHREKMYKAINGDVFGSDPWRSNALMLLAISHAGSAEVTNDPHEMMRIANGYAIAGLPRLISLLENRGGDTALDHLSDEVEKMIKPKK